MNLDAAFCWLSYGKLNNVREYPRDLPHRGTILGANGTSLEFPVIRHADNLEAVRTYEGTVEMHTLIIGQALIGLPPFR